MRGIDKKGLYKEVDCIRDKYGLNEFPIKINALCKTLNINVATVPFSTQGLRGMAFKGGTFADDVILLSDKRTKLERNVDCCHEFMHLQLQRDEPLVSFNCFEKVRPQQNSYFEWQANEGSAELLVPRNVLLAEIKKVYPSLNSDTNISNLKDNLANKFDVPEIVIQYCLESLKYEIYQFVNGTDIDKIDILSANKQSQYGINIKSLNDIEFDMFNNEFKKWKENKKSC